MNSTQSTCLTHSQEDRFHKKMVEFGMLRGHDGKVFSSVERKLDPATLGIQMAHWGWSSLPERQKRLWFLGILRFEKSCSWRSLFNSGPNSKMSPTQSTCLNHGFKTL
jgi:hypothetical protein